MAAERTCRTPASPCRKAWAEDPTDPCSGPPPPTPTKGQFTLRGPGLNDLRELRRWMRSVDPSGVQWSLDGSRGHGGAVCLRQALITLRGRTADRRGQARVLVEP
ncbi:MAG: hypothetical protein IPM68_01480 [Flavobacteriales bacterium]|nr:hypothetical protein [Flavobacteriales bacterium]